MKKKIVAFLLALTLVLQSTGIVIATDETGTDNITSATTESEISETQNNTTENSDEENVKSSEIKDSLAERTEAILNQAYSLTDNATQNELATIYNKLSTLNTEIQNAYAENSITESEYHSLSERMNEVANEVIGILTVFGYDPYGTEDVDNEDRVNKYNGPDINVDDGDLRTNGTSQFCLTAADSEEYGNILNINAEISYKYSDVILGLKEAENVEVKVPASVAVTEAQLSAREEQGIDENYWTSGMNGELSSVVAATKTNKETICNSNEYYVIYKNIGTYASKDPIHLKISVEDYEIIDNPDYTNSSYTENHVPLISLRLDEFKPGVCVYDISWITLKYEFINDEGESVTVNGNTTYYDVDGSQVVHLHDNYVSLSITETPGADGTNDCVLYIGEITGESGVCLYEYKNQGTNEGVATSRYAFTECFSGSSLTRTFSFKQGTANSQGLIYHNGLPVVRNTGDLTVSKTVTGGFGDVNKEFKFTVQLNEAINGTFGDMTFTQGKAEFTLKHGESKTATGLYEFIGYTVTETDNEGYVVTVNGKVGSIGSGEIYSKEAIENGAEAAVENFVNNREAVPDTGIHLDSTAYILILLAVISGAICLIVFKRRKIEAL